jgi:CheY-like chemotaxis protein
MTKGSARETVRGFIPPGALQGSQLQRIVTQALDRVVSAEDRDAIVTMALVATSATAMPETAGELTAFVFGPLRDAVDQARGNETSERLLMSLTPFLKQACRHEGSDPTQPPPEPTSSQPPTSSEPPPTSSTAVNILVVEHDARTRAQLGQHLRGQGYEVFTAPDGHVALAVSMRNRPDLVIAAVTMPVVGGRQLMALLKVAFSADAPPVLLMADADAGADKIEGAAAVVPKPLDAEQLLERVAAILAARDPDARKR